MSPQLPRLFVWHVVRGVARHRLLALLNVLSVALGVAVFLAIQIANHSANRSFGASIDLVAGKANLEVRAAGGAFAETLLPTLSRAPGVKAATPLVEGYITLPDFPGETLQVLGIDPFSNLPFATFALENAEHQSLDVEAWLRDAGAIALSEEFAKQHGLKLGDTLRVTANGRESVRTIRFLLRLTESPAGTNTRVAALDIAWAQELLDKVGRLSSIQLLLDEPAQAAALAAKLRALVPADVSVLVPGQRSGQIQNMLAGFELNLSALSLVSLLVGMFLIHNTIAASVVRRRAEIGMLRALGATRGEVMALFVGEALLFGLAGVLAGIGGGFLLAGWLVGAVAKTISSLYVLVSIDAFHVTPLLLVVTAVFGLGSVLIAAWFPAREGARLDPIRALNLGTILEAGLTSTARWSWLGVAGLIFAAICSWLALATGPALLGFVSALGVVAGCAFFAPAATKAGAFLFDRASRHTLLVRLAAQNLGRSLHRNAVTVAALMSAIAMTVGVTIMIHSFRRTVEVWIDRTVVADIFLTPIANDNAAIASFTPAELAGQAAALPRVERMDTYRGLGVTVREQFVALAVVAGSRRDNLAFLGGGDAQKQARLFDPQTVLVSEPFARRFGLWDGDRVPIPTPRGVVDFTIGGVYFDYSRDSGVIMMSRQNFDRQWDDSRVQSLAFYLRDGAQTESVADELRALSARFGKFLVYSNRSLRIRVFEIFDQTFRVTSILQAISVLVAVVGIFLALTTLVAEREREIGVLRAVGASAGQIRGLVLAESGLIGAVASLLGVAAGIVLSFVLTYVINKAFFGWTIQLSFPWLTVLATPLWIVPAALLAGVIPAARAARLEIARAVRRE